MGLLYLLCYEHTHYVGFANDREHLKERIKRHRNGTGARHTTRNGPNFEVVRLFRNATPKDEKLMKAMSPKNFCPCCSDYIGKSRVVIGSESTEEDILIALAENSEKVASA